MPFLYNENEAIKAKLGGLTVTDGNDPLGRAVPVRFRAPEQELADEVFPAIVIDEANWSVDPERAHSGYVPLPYTPEGYAAPDPGSWLFTQMPLPLNVDWTVTLYCRKSLHRTALLGQLGTFPYLPGRLGFLQVPQDGTLRRLEVIGGPTTDSVLDGQGKRLLTAVWRIRTTGELIWAPIDPVTETTSIDLTVSPIGPAGI